MADIRILLTDKTIAQLSSPNDGWYLDRDTELKGFFVVVGKRKRTFTVQGDLRRGGKRASSIRVSIGDTREMSTRTARAIAKEHLAQISKGQHPKAGNRGGQVGAADQAASKPGAQVDVTLKQAERLIGSIRRECLDHVVVFSERHLRHLLESHRLMLT